MCICMYVTGVNMATIDEVHKQDSTRIIETMCADDDLTNIYQNDYVLVNKDISLEVKINALVQSWHELASLTALPSTDNLKKLTDFLKSHTLNIVLSASWMKYKDKFSSSLISAIEKCITKFSTFQGFPLLCAKLASLVQSPWGKQVIINMLNVEEPQTSWSDYNFFVNEESGYIISMRLKKLCEDKCEDMALNLTRAYIRCCEMADDQQLNMYLSDDQKKFVFDIYLALLYKLNHTTEMSNLLKNLTLPEGVDMVRRFTAKRVSVCRIWQESFRIAQLCGTIFLTRGVMQPLDETAALLNDLLHIWLPLYDAEKDMDELQECLRRIMRTALTAPHMYLFCKQLHQKFGVAVRAYLVEIYIQAINTDLNIYERFKTEDNKGSEIITERVADGLMQLADLLEENVNVSRECVLSAFSLRPTESYLRKIEELARVAGYKVIDTGQWKCKLHPCIAGNEDVLIMCDTCHDYTTEMKVNTAVKLPNLVLTEALKSNNMGLNEQLCDDLVVIIFCARYQLLNWLQNWDDLHRLCAMYLTDPIRTKNLITELKFVEIDYTPFLMKREIGLYDEEEDEIDGIITAGRRKKRRRSPTRSELEDTKDNEVPYIDNNSPKSDSEVTKTLRSFRKAIKQNFSDASINTWYHPPQQSSTHDTIQYHNGNSPKRIRIQENHYMAHNHAEQYNNSEEFFRFSNEQSSNTIPIHLHQGQSQSESQSQLQLHQQQQQQLKPQKQYISVINPIRLQSLQERNVTYTQYHAHHANFDNNVPVIRLERRNGQGLNVSSPNSTTTTTTTDPSLISLSPVKSEVSVQDSLHTINLSSKHDVKSKSDDSDRFLCDINNIKHEDMHVIKNFHNDTVSNGNNLDIKPKLEKQDSNDFESQLLEGTNTSSIEMSPAALEMLEEELFGDVAEAEDVEEVKFFSVSRCDNNKIKITKNNECSDNQDQTSNACNDCKALDNNSSTDDDDESSMNTKISSQITNYQELYNLKDARVILTRVDDLLLKKKKKSLKRRAILKVRCRGKKKQSLDNNSFSISENVQSEEKTNKDENFNSHHTSPLQSQNPRVVINSTYDIEALRKKILMNADNNIPQVLLQRLEESRVKSLLARIPGIKDTNLFQPRNTDCIVNVVQVAGGRATSTASNTQTSTQVSPHIQRIGQPRNEKSDQSSNSEQSTANTKSQSNTYTISKPASTQAPTLINILSQQIIRPSASNNNNNNNNTNNNNTTTTRRTGPLINILSQQTIRPANTTAICKTSTTTVTTDSQANNTTRIITTSNDQPQLISQIVSPGRTTGPIKTVVGTSNSEQGRIVQFICKSTDGKLIPVTSFPSNRLVKVGATQSITTAPDSPNLEENFTKLVPNKKTESNEISETLPKFQQAFGKSVYQNNVDASSNATTNVTNNVNNDTTTDKAKTSIKTSTVSVQPIQGGVIYTRQMPVGQTINLIPQTRGQVFRIATTNAEQISFVKDTVIHSKMSALLAAALQGKPKNADSSNSTTETEGNADSNATANTTRVQLTTRPTLVQNARIVKPVLQIPSNVIRNTPQNNLSSTTLEQLREFDMVYKQVKERSSTSTPADTSAPVEANESSSPQRISVTYLNQGQKINCAPVVVVSSYNNLQPAASPALSVASQGSSSPCVTPAPTPTPVLPKVVAKGSKGKSVKNAPLHASKTSPIPKPQQKPQEDEHTTQRIFDILAEYAEQLRNSPDLNNKPAPRRRSNPPTNPSQNSKRKKSSSSKKSGQSNSLPSEADVDDPRTVGSEDSSCGVVQLSMQEEEPAATTPAISEATETSTVTTRQQLILTDSTHNQTRNLIIADSSVGEALKMPNTAVLVPGNYIMPVSMVKGGQQIAVVSGGSKILATVPARSGPNMLLFQSFLNQNRKTNVPTVKYSTIQPISGISSQTLTGVSAQPPVILPPPSHGISTVTLSQPIAIKKLEEPERVNTELLLTISQSRENNCTTTEDTPQPDSSTNTVVQKIENVDLDENTAMSDHSSEKTFSYQKPLIKAPIATPVIAQNIKDEINDEPNETATTQTIMTLNINPLESKNEDIKVEERVQSVLVTAGSSNGPMLSHSPPQYKQSECNSDVNEQTKDEFLRNGGKRNERVQQSTVFCMQGKIKKPTGNGRLDREVQQICMQRRQAALEREIRLQKSLSEECEDLGVDEPSTSDLFPEALLFDSNNSPSFDQTSQDVLKRSAQSQEKEENKLTLFSDDDFMFESGQYPSENQLCYEEAVDSRILTNGQGSTGEDNTLLQTCTSMSDVTLCSPISPDTYHTNTPPPLNKFMHKYTNKKKNDRIKQNDNWPSEVSSSEDTTGSNDLIKCSSSPEICLQKQRSDEDLSEGSFKVVRLSISKSECSEVHCSDDTDCSVSGRGARKSVKKMCSCCNGAEDNSVSRKRPSSHQYTNNPHKKAFPNKKR